MKSIQKSKRNLTLAKVIVSLVLTVLLWAVVTDAWGYSKFFLNFPGYSWTKNLYDLFSRFIWAVPAIVLLLIYANNVPTTLKQLFTNKPNIKPLLISVAVIVIYNLGAMFVNHGGLWINPQFSFAKHFPMFIMVAFAEEIVYRGWGLNALSAFLSVRKANVISTVFFILLHLPAYFIQAYLGGSFPVQTIITQCTFALILGLLFGYLYSKGKSLWSPMILHFLADFLSLALVA